MDSGLYSSYSGVRALADMLEVLSNNLANVRTSGFKGDESFFSIYNRTLSESTIAPLDKAINDSSVVEGSVVDFRPGPMVMTGRELDVALEGSGFFVINTPGGVGYTRNGDFQLSAKGQLVTSEGLAVMGSKGPITLPAGKVSISQAGEVEVNGARIDKLKVVDFQDKRALEKVGDSLFKNGSTTSKEQEVTGLIVRGGSLEQSNVNPIRQMTLMISITRQFESLQKAIQMIMNTMNDKSINQVGRPLG
jgi:flagellar basal-body rod protein FlgF